jgi:hypothetical protein
MEKPTAPHLTKINRQDITFVCPTLHCAAFTAHGILSYVYSNSLHAAMQLMFDPVRLGSYYTYHQVYHSTILRSAHTVYLCVLQGLQIKPRLFPSTALTDWFYN